MSKSKKNPIKVSLFTKKKGILTKRISINDEGLIDKNNDQCMLSEGDYEVVTLADLDDFDVFLDTIRHNQAVCYGRAEPDQAKVVARSKLKDHPGAITRTKDRFNFVGATILMLDYDYDGKGEALTPIQLRDVLYDTIPETREVDVLWRPSASSCIYKDGKEIIGVTGQRLYLVVNNGEFIDEFTEYLTHKLWIAGHGKILLSKSGVMLDRTIFDTMVWQAERLDFVAGAKCVPPLYRKPVDSIIWRGTKPMLDITEGYVTTVEMQSRYQTLLMDTKRSMRKEQETVKRNYSERRAKEQLPRLTKIMPDKSVEEVTKYAERLFLQAVQDSILTADFPIHIDDEGWITVADVLNDKNHYNGMTLADPLEPEYGGSGGKPAAGKAKLFLIGTKPIINSFAHGGRTFELKTQTRDIQVGEGRQTEIIREITETLREEFDLFCNDSGLIRTELSHSGTPRIKPINPETLTCRVAERMRFYRLEKPKKGSSNKKDDDHHDDEPKKLWVDPPPKIMSLMAKRNDDFGLRFLNGIITAPTIRDDMTLITKPGFDEKSGLILYYPDEYEEDEIPLNPTHEQIEEAKEIIEAPFKHFNYVSSLDKSVLISAVLTAAVRRSLYTAPGVVISATTAGSGKTKLALCLEIIAGGEGITHALPYGEEEIRKVITSTLLEGTPSLIFDNISTPPKSDVLCAVLTSAKHSDRILGTKDKPTLSARMQMILTGNNCRVIGDLSRRVVMINLDPGTDRPWTREFPFDPVAVVRRDRMKIIRACLTLIRAFHVSGKTLVKAHTGSYEQWSAVIRQTVMFCGYDDPEKSFNNNYQDDSETATISDVMHLWHKVFGTEVVQNIRISDFIASGGVTMTDDDEYDEAYRELFNVFKDVASGYGRMTSRSVGNWLGKYRGRVVEGFRFQQVRSKSSRGWMLDTLSTQTQNNEQGEADFLDL